MKVILQGASEVGVAGTGARDGFSLVLAAIDVLDRERVSPVFPIAIADEHCDRGSDGLGMADARDDLDLIGFDFHASTAAVALLAAPEFAIHFLDGDGDPGGEPGERGHQTFTMGFACGFKPEHS